MSNRLFDFGVTFVPPVRLQHASTALLIVDMQERGTVAGQGTSLALERILPGSTEYFNRRIEGRVIPNISRLLDYCRSRGVLVVYLTFGSVHRDLRDMPSRLRQMLCEFEASGGVKDIYWSENPCFKIRSELTPRPGELVVNKTTFGAFSSTALQHILREKNITALIVTGVSTNCCVETTAREAADRGFECVLVDEAMADYDARAHEEALRGFYFNFGRVVRSAEDVIAGLREGAAL